MNIADTNIIHTVNILATDWRRHVMYHNVVRRTLRQAQLNCVGSGQLSMANIRANQQCELFTIFISTRKRHGFTE